MGLFDWFWTAPSQQGAQVVRNIQSMAPVTSEGAPYVSSPAPQPAPTPPVVQSSAVRGETASVATMQRMASERPGYLAQYGQFAGLITPRPEGGWDTRAADLAMQQRSIQLAVMNRPELQARTVASLAFRERQAAVSAHAAAVRSGDWGQIEATRVRYLQAEAAHNVAMSYYGGEAVLTSPTKQMRDYGISPGKVVLPSVSYLSQPSPEVIRTEQKPGGGPYMLYAAGAPPTDLIGGAAAWWENTNRYISSRVTGAAPGLIPAIEKYASPFYQVATLPIFGPATAGQTFVKLITGSKEPTTSQLYAEMFKGYVKYPIEEPLSAGTMVVVGGILGLGIRGVGAAAASTRGAAFLAKHPTFATVAPKAFTYGLGAFATYGIGTQVLAPVPAGVKEEVSTISAIREVSPVERYLDTTITTTKTPQYRAPTQLEMSQRFGRAMGELTFGLAGAYGGYHLPEIAGAAKGAATASIKTIRSTDMEQYLLGTYEVRPTSRATMMWSEPGSLYYVRTRPSGLSQALEARASPITKGISDLDYLMRPGYGPAGEPTTFMERLGVVHRYSQAYTKLQATMRSSGALFGKPTYEPVPTKLELKARFNRIMGRQEISSEAMRDLQTNIYGEKWVEARDWFREYRYVGRHEREATEIATRWLERYSPPGTIRRVTGPTKPFDWAPPSGEVSVRGEPGNAALKAIVRITTKPASLSEPSATSYLSDVTGRPAQARTLPTSELLKAPGPIMARRGGIRFEEETEYVRLGVPSPVPSMKQFNIVRQEKRVTPVQEIGSALSSFQASLQRADLSSAKASILRSEQATASINRLVSGTTQQPRLDIKSAQVPRQETRLTPTSIVTQTSWLTQDVTQITTPDLTRIVRIPRPPPPATPLGWTEKLPPMPALVGWPGRGGGGRGSGIPTYLKRGWRVLNPTPTLASILGTGKGRKRKRRR